MGAKQKLVKAIDSPRLPRYVAGMPTQEQSIRDRAVELILLRTLEQTLRAAGPAVTHGQRIALAALDSLRAEIAGRDAK